MDAAAADAHEPSAASRGNPFAAFPVELHPLLLSRLPPDALARAACVCRAWRAIAAQLDTREHLDFQGVTLRVDNATLARLCARAGAALRTLCLDADACRRINGSGLVAALRDGGCTGLRRINAPSHRTPWQHTLTFRLVGELLAACPRLQHVACGVSCRLSEAGAVTAALLGLLELSCVDGSDAGLEQLAERLRVNATLTTLTLGCTAILAPGAKVLAESLCVNKTLTSLDLAFNRVGKEGAAQLAACLRVNTTLRSLNLHYNGIGDAGAKRLAQCLRFNTTLTSLDLSQTPSAPRARGIWRRVCVRTPRSRA